MNHRPLLVAALLLTGLAVPSESLACGYKPGCKPTVTPVPTVATPKPTPTVAPPVVVIPTSVPPATPVVVAPLPSGAGGSRLSEYCHYEPSTAQWEIRLSSDADKMVRQGGEQPVAPHVCDQHVVVEQPSAQPPVVEQPTIEQPPVEVVPVEQPTVMPPAEEIVSPPAEELPPMEEEVPPCVPVQIPGACE